MQVKASMLSRLRERMDCLEAEFFLRFGRHSEQVRAVNLFATRTLAGAQRLLCLAIGRVHQP